MKSRSKSKLTSRKKHKKSKKPLNTVHSIHNEAQPTGTGIDMPASKKLEQLLIKKQDINDRIDQLKPSLFEHLSSQILPADSQTTALKREYSKQLAGVFQKASYAIIALLASGSAAIGIMLFVNNTNTTITGISSLLLIGMIATASELIRQRGAENHLHEIRDAVITGLILIDIVMNCYSRQASDYIMNKVARSAQSSQQKQIALSGLNEEKNYIKEELKRISTEKSFHHTSLGHFNSQLKSKNDAEQRNDSNNSKRLNLSKK